MHAVYLYLFGSQARGDENNRSDTDFAVKFDQKKVQNTFKAKLELMSRLTEILGSDAIDVVDISTAPPLLHYNIIKDGTVICSSNEKERIMDKARAMSVYFDRQYYYKRHAKRALEKLAK